MYRGLRKWFHHFPFVTYGRVSRYATVDRRTIFAVAGALFVAGFTLSALTLTWGIGPHDEGLMLQWANRVASGQMPYRDFWCNYAPAEPLLLAGLVKLFGPSLLMWRLLRALIGAAFAVFVYLFICGAGSRLSDHCRAQLSGACRRIASFSACPSNAFDRGDSRRFCGAVSF